MPMFSNQNGPPVPSRQPTRNRKSESDNPPPRPYRLPSTNSNDPQSPLVTPGTASTCLTDDQNSFNVMNHSHYDSYWSLKKVFASNKAYIFNKTSVQSLNHARYDYFIQHLCQKLYAYPFSLRPEVLKFFPYLGLKKLMIENLACNCLQCNPP